MPCVRHALAAGANPNARNRNGLTPLMVHLETDPRLRNYGSLEQNLEMDRRALRIAVVLIQEGADPNLKNSSGSTALIYAISNQYEPVARYLLQSGANPNHPGAGNRKPLQVFIEAYSESFERIRTPPPVEQEFYESFVAKALSDVSDPRERRIYLKRLMQGALNSQHFEAIPFLLQLGARADGLYSGSEALSYTVYSDGVAALGATHALLMHGAQSTGAPNSMPAYHRAAAAGSTKALRLMHAAGIAVDHPGERDETALMRAAEARQSEAVAFLIQAGAQVNAKDKTGKSALMYAALPGNLAVLQTLLKHGSDPNARDKAGATPLMYAAKAIGSQPRPPDIPQTRSPNLFDFGRAWQVQESRVGSKDIPPAAIVEELQKKVLREEHLTKETEEISRQTDGKIPIYTDSLQFLLRNGARPEMKDNQGRGLLQYAPEGGREALAEEMRN